MSKNERKRVKERCSTGDRMHEKRRGWNRAKERRRRKKNTGIRALHIVQSMWCSNMGREAGGNRDGSSPQAGKRERFTCTFYLDVCQTRQYTVTVRERKRDSETDTYRQARPQDRKAGKESVGVTGHANDYPRESMGRWESCLLLCYTIVGKYLSNYSSSWFLIVACATLIHTDGQKDIDRQRDGITKKNNEKWHVITDIKRHIQIYAQYENIHIICAREENKTKHRRKK